jgi:hypothetical protein
MIFAADVDKILIPLDKISSFSQSRRAVKAQEYETVRTATDKHRFPQIGIQKTSAALE